MEELTYRGVRFEFPASVLTDRMRQAFSHNFYEVEESEELPYLLQDGEVVLELGAGVGFISTLCAKDPRVSKVFAIEANPALIPICRRTYELNDVSVTIFNEMVGPQSGHATFHVHKDFWASSTMPGEGATPVEIPVTSFQQRLDEIQPTMLIVDIEGGEVDLFDGVNLACVRKIMLEIHQYAIGRLGVKKLFDTLSAQNFHYEQWHSRRGIVTFSAVDRDVR
ncbi:FkbM family methyltransferase [Propylenella binzhouense]|uniref:FkbM family methyltransferase n=1 Tax=Propylenella binzhouense TaxID=2555902 RepID=UPI001369F94C